MQTGSRCGKGWLRHREERDRSEDDPPLPWSSWGATIRGGPRGHGLDRWGAGRCWLELTQKRSRWRKGWPHHREERDQ
jgi:hypothetical protein